jgi:hypothetical protein
VQLEVTVPIEPKNVQQIRSALEQKLQDAGMTVAPSSRVKLVARLETAKEKAVSYFGGESAIVRDKINILEYQVDGAVVWQRKLVVGAPGMLMRNRGESIQEAIDRLVQPNVSFFVNEWVPGLVQDPKTQAAGKSQFTLSGIRPS